MNILSMYGQEHIIEHLKSLSAEAQQNLIDQISSIDIDTLQLQKALLHQPQHQQREISPIHTYAKSGNADNAARGRSAIASGEVACLILAGGQGSRLGFSGPKGMYPISCIKKKTLFQLFAEKTLAAGHQAQRMLPIAIMTSPINHDETVQFFKDHEYFGLDPNQVSFFSQKMLPFLDVDGRIFLSSPDALAEGPDGNGGALYQIVHSGIWRQWLHHGVRYVNVILVDNPLADPFDAELVGYAINQHADVVIKSTLRVDEAENVGVVVQEKSKTVVVEYTEMSSSEYTSRNDNGDLNYNCANLSLFCLGMDFIKSIAQKKDALPLHKAFKATPYLNAKGHVVTPSSPNAWKYERFIFDILPNSSKTSVLLYPRESCFAPLKNSTGQNSPATVQKALEARDRSVLQSVFGIECPASQLEISQEFYYPTEELIKKWKGKHLENGGYLS